MIERWCRERKKKKFRDREDKGEREDKRNCVFLFLKFENWFKIWTYPRNLCPLSFLVPSLKMNHNGKWLSNNYIQYIYALDPFKCEHVVIIWHLIDH